VLHQAGGGYSNIELDDMNDDAVTGAELRRRGKGSRFCKQAIAQPCLLTAAWQIGSN